MPAYNMNRSVMSLDASREFFKVCHIPDKHIIGCKCFISSIARLTTKNTFNIGPKGNGLYKVYIEFEKRNFAF